MYTNIRSEVELNILMQELGKFAVYENCPCGSLVYFYTLPIDWAKNRASPMRA